MFYLNNQKIAAAIGLALMLGFNVSTAQAAIIYPSASQTAIGVDDVVFVEIRMDTEGQAINVVEGELLLSDGSKIEIRDFNQAGSDLQLWTRPPSLQTKENRIYFSGGVPGGINKSNALLFKMAIAGKDSGQTAITPMNIKAYRNDAKATLLPVTIKSMEINVSSSSVKTVDELAAAIAGDKQKPQSLTADIGQDPSLYDGKKFLTFSAIDNESGIDFYEVKEGDRPAVQADSVYILQNQEKMETITVTAYDKAGNSRQIIVREKSVQTGRYPWVVSATLILIAILAAVVGLSLIFIKRRKKNENF